ncbi:aminotransferase class-III domain-containing protein [Hirsutella rhossiliensis]|uniref:Aminotransferase class-III domain-containing protein n=1 Tax=Hirsutella rhossiliensis TaxID=111463 RepID=A0A9P8SEP4_9HYPO|nr:aminotransferase class-III domain-containing protein [Hirsutella rhossiliensis]KAH0958251.1 aminotransferase class-III domain-containing protein [Hirsutella rhossiliensis]
MESPLASLLWRSLRVYQVFGANTDVGKTVFATLLGRTARKLWRDEAVTYLKPVSTGPAHEADHCHINRFVPGVAYKTLFQYDIPVSPHKAALASGKPVPSEDALLAKCREYAADCNARRGKGWLFLETAGGVHSPSVSGRTQADLYIPLRIPTVLIGDSRLGGISQTISAFESLLLRGYQVESILLFENARYENHRYLSDYFQEHHRVPVTSAAEPPRKSDDARLDAEAMAEYYDRTGCRETAGSVLEHLRRRHSERIASLESLPEKAHRHIWYPFTQQSLLGPADIMAIDSAHGDHFQTLIPQAATEDAASGKSLLRSSFDGSASWWTQGLGHSNPRLTLAAASAAGRYGHVMFAGAVHEPAMELAETLLQTMGNPRLSRVFYSDNGSTGNEVALKMGLRAARLRYGPDDEQQLGILGLKGGYHGDTLGAMDCAEPCLFNDKVEWYDGKGYWFDYPTVLCSNGEWSVKIDGGGLRAELGDAKRFRSLDEIFDMEAREKRGEHQPYEKHIVDILDRLHKQGRRFGALILEPIVIGAGGMALVDPLFQRTLVNVVRRSTRLFSASSGAASPPPTTGPHDWAGLPVIFDEVFTGLYRLGRRTPSSFLGVHPDISVHAKLLTGGLVPLCATLASESIFDVFSSPDKTDALLHGHSYTAHPVGCQVALESVRAMQAMERRGDWDWAKNQGWTGAGRQEGDNLSEGVWSVWPRDFVESLSRRSQRVDGVWALGSVLAIHLRDGAGTGYSSNAAAGLREALGRGRDEPGVRGPWNVHARVLGNVLYLMTSQTTTESSIRQLTELVEESLAT